LKIPSLNIPLPLGINSSHFISSTYLVDVYCSVARVFASLMSTVSAVECVKQCASERTACCQHRDFHYRRVIKNCHGGNSRKNYVHCEPAPDDLADTRSA